MIEVRIISIYVFGKNTCILGGLSEESSAGIAEDCSDNEFVVKERHVPIAGFNERIISAAVDEDIPAVAAGYSVVAVGVSTAVKNIVKRGADQFIVAGSSYQLYSYKVWVYCVTYIAAIAHAAEVKQVITGHRIDDYRITLSADAVGNEVVVYIFTDDADFLHSSGGLMRCNRTGDKAVRAVVTIDKQDIGGIVVVDDKVRNGHLHRFVGCGRVIVVVNMLGYSGRSVCYGVFAHIYGNFLYGRSYQIFDRDSIGTSTGV